MKRNKMQLFLLAITVLAAMVVAGLFILSLAADRPDTLGVQPDGRLAPLPKSPNCVSTQTDDQDRWMQPLSFQGTPQEALDRLESVIRSMPRSTIVTRTDRYLHAEFRSALFGFVDDVEFLVDPDTHRIHFRSASRVGWSDLGVNRQRMEEIARRLTEAESDNAAADK